MYILNKTNIVPILRVIETHFFNVSFMILYNMVCSIYFLYVYMCHNILFKTHLCFYNHIVCQNNPLYVDLRPIYYMYDVYIYLIYENLYQIFSCILYEIKWNVNFTFFLLIAFFPSEEVENQITENYPMSVEVTGAVNTKSHNTGKITNHSKKNN